MPLDPAIIFKDFTIGLNGIIAETGVAAIKELSEDVAKEAETLYYNFFGELYAAINAGNGATPSRFMANMGGEGPWKPLSEKWSDRKLAAGGSADFYFGLTAQLNNARRKAVKKRRRQGQKGESFRAKKTFIKFLEGMATSSQRNVKKYFGAIEIKYDITATGRKTPIKLEQKGNVISELGRITSHNAKGKIIPNYDNVTLNSEITMFPLLRAIEDFSEWYVVNYLAKQDKSNSVQWAKINSRVGFRNSNRPIRAMIAPLISWYATTGLPQALRRFYS